MPLGSRGGGQRSYKPRYPIRIGPDVEEGGGGGGGTAPAAPSDVTTPTVAWRMIGDQQGGFDAYNTLTIYNRYIADGFGGFQGQIGQQGGTDPNLMQGTTANGASNAYQTQKAWEGLPGSWNNNVSNQGYYRAHAQNSAIEAWTASQDFYPPVFSPSQGLVWWDDPSWAAFSTRFGGYAAGTKFLGGIGLYFDSEFDQGRWDTATHPGHTAAEKLVKVEQRGYEMGIAIFTAFPACHIVSYSNSPGMSWHDKYVYNPPNGRSNLADSRMIFWYGVMRAGAELGSTGHWAWIDHRLGYRLDPGLAPGTPLLSYETAIKIGTQGMLAEFSQTLPAASRNHWMDKIDWRMYTWAGTDNTAYYQARQFTEPGYSNHIELARKWSMGGRRWEYVYNGTPDRPGGGTKYPGISPYYGSHASITGRLAGMQAAQSTSTAHSTTAPALSASKSGSGTTRTLTGTASHAYGIRCVKAYIYPSGAPVMATMTYNLGGGSPAAGVANSYMEWTLQLTGVGSNQYAIVTAYSTLDQQKSTVVTL